MSGAFTEKNSLVPFYKGKALEEKGLKLKVCLAKNKIIRVINHEDSGHSWLAAPIKGNNP